MVIVDSEELLPDKVDRGVPEGLLGLSQGIVLQEGESGDGFDLSDLLQMINVGGVDEDFQGLFNTRVAVIVLVLREKDVIEGLESIGQRSGVQSGGHCQGTVTRLHKQSDVVSRSLFRQM